MVQEKAGPEMVHLGNHRPGRPVLVIHHMLLKEGGSRGIPPGLCNFKMGGVPHLNITWWLSDARLRGPGGVKNMDF